MLISKPFMCQVIQHAEVEGSIYSSGNSFRSMNHFFGIFKWWAGTITECSICFKWLDESSTSIFRSFKLLVQPVGFLDFDQDQRIICLRLTIGNSVYKKILIFLTMGCSFFCLFCRLFYNSRNYFPWHKVDSQGILFFSASCVAYAKEQTSFLWFCWVKFSLGTSQRPLHLQ